MTRLIAEWIWRTAILAALAWIGLSLHLIHEDMKQPADDPQATAAAPDADDDAQDEVRRQLALLNQKLDAVMIAMAQLKR
jgi:hypothetical protein